MVVKYVSGGVIPHGLNQGGAVMATVQDVFRWMDRDFRFCDSPRGTVEVKENGYDPTRGDDCLRFSIYTDTNRYSIVAKEGNQNRVSYLGCVASSRKPRAGEDWTRGRDLADGSLSEETWRKILADIVSYELVKVHSDVSRHNVVGVCTGDTGLTGISEKA